LKDEIKEGAMLEEKLAEKNATIENLAEEVDELKE
jgi:hypothetical protein